RVAELPLRPLAERAVLLRGARARRGQCLRLRRGLGGRVPRRHHPAHDVPAPPLAEIELLLTVPPARGGGGARRDGGGGRLPLVLTHVERGRREEQRAEGEGGAGGHLGRSYPRERRWGAVPSARAGDFRRRKAAPPVWARAVDLGEARRCP